MVKKDEVQKVYRRIMEAAGARKWQEFKNEVKKCANAEDNYRMIEFGKFQEVLQRVLNCKLTKDEKDLIVQVCGKTVFQNLFIDITYLSIIQFNQQLKKIFDQLQLSELETDEAKDAAGFTGEFRRAAIDLQHISQEQFISFFVLYPKKISELMLAIRGIDSDRNGFITQTELDDILKLILSNE